ncbi:helix-turn-helix domain-containing protein [Levilactobacillus andaensis]|uniref:helix-turn-helix domain-containing protein n=1 Tax=Levilactobacillus andaensis TaxID=2799570 RepID=UPI001940C375|nr:helix-turn-helix transcriptional regulator [Levilactobacillus andaensis]
MTLNRIDDYIQERKKASAEFTRAYDQAGVDLEIAVAVKQLRESLGLSQREFAGLVGKPQSMIARIETGAVTATNKTLADIAAKTYHQLRIQFVQAP